MFKEKMQSVFSKAKNSFSKCNKKILGVSSGLMSALGLGIVASAEEGGSDVVGGITSVFSNINSTFTFANIVKILAIVVGAAAVLTLGWFGVRKVIAIIQRALKKGKVSV